MYREYKQKPKEVSIRIIATVMVLVIAFIAVIVAIPANLYNDLT